MTGYIRFFCDILIYFVDQTTFTYLVDVVLR